MTLTEVSYFSRKFAPFGVLLLVIILIFFYTIKLVFMFAQLNQPKVLDIDTVFNQISAPQFPEATPSSRFTYIIDTVEGEPITSTETAKIFFLPKAKFQFGYKEKISIMAKKLGFEGVGLDYRLAQNNTEAIFSDSKRKLRIDINNFNFKFDQDITRSPELFEVNGTPIKEEAQNRAIDFLKSFDRHPDDLAKGTMKVIFLQYDKVSSQTAVIGDNHGANMVEVDFYRAEIDQSPIVSPTFFNSQNYVTMVHTGQDYKVVSSQIQFFEKSEEQFGIYPVIDGKTAFEKLATGSGYIVAGATSTQKQIPITDMFVAYYDPNVYQEYLQPVYVFMNPKLNFVGYVPAVTDEYLIR